MTKRSIISAGTIATTYPIPAADGPFSEHYPAANRFAVEIRDDKAPTAKKWAYCIDAIDTKLTIEPGRVYLIHRRWGDLVETAFYEAQAFFSDRIEFASASPDPAHGEHLKFVAPRDLKPDPEADIFVAGLLYQFTFIFDECSEAVASVAARRQARTWFDIMIPEPWHG